MRTLMRHCAFPGQTSDGIDDLDAVMPPEIVALCRSSVSKTNSQRESLNIRAELMTKHGLFLDEYRLRQDATHTLTASRLVYLLKL